MSAQQRRQITASPLTRDVRAMAPAALGLGLSALLAIVYVLGLGETFSVLAGLVAAAAVCTGASQSSLS